jgi:histidinol-phosphate phosphatase family protein
LIELRFSQTVRKQSRGLIIFDRDGTLITNVVNLKDSGDIEWLPNRRAILKEINSRGFDWAIATNQASIGRGIITADQFFLITLEMLKKLEDDTNRPISIVACPHKYDELTSSPSCKCRKPNPGMLDWLIRSTGIGAEKTLFVGDSESDRAASLNCKYKVSFSSSSEDGKQFFDVIDAWMRSKEQF